MGKHNAEEDTDGEDEQTLEEQGALDSTEEGFIQGYSEEEEVEECAECGTAVRPEKKISKEFGEESYTFCSDDCAREFEESLGE